MALTEEKVLATVELCLEAETINVKWINKIQRDGETISAIPHRKAYSSDQIDEFRAEVEGAQTYIAALGW